MAVVVSELVTNAVVHARSEAQVWLAIRKDSRSLPTMLRLEVRDTDTRPPRFDQPDALSMGGRGLRLVADLSSRHGWTATDLGKAVWAELDLV